MRLEHLIYFMETIQSGSFNKAAANLYLTQPALNAAITALEKELNSPLLNRSAYGVTPTAFGKKVFDEAPLVIDTIANWKAYGVSLSHKITLNISTIPLGSVFIVRDILPNLLKTMPNLELFLYDFNLATPKPLSTDNLDQLIKMNILEKNSDIILTAHGDTFSDEIKHYLDENNWAILPICRSPYFVFFSPNSSLAKQKKITLKALKNYPIGLTTSNSTRPIAEELKSLGFSDFIYVSNHHALREMIANNLAITFITALSGKLSYNTNNALCCSPVKGYDHYLHYILLYKTDDAKNCLLLRK